MSGVRCAPVVFAFLLLSRPAPAEPVAAPPGGGPVEVGVGLHIVDIAQINEVDNTFSIEVDVVGTWMDPRLAFDPEEAGTDRQTWFGPAADQVHVSMWNTQLTAANTLGEPHRGSRNLTIDADGRVTFRARVTAALRAPLDFHRFPFDHQVLPIEVESYLWDANAVVLRPLDGLTGFDPDFDLPEWRVLGMRTRSRENERSGYETPFSQAVFEIEVARKAGYYLWKIVVPLVVIVMISWVVFYMKGERLGRRAGVSATGILTVIAYQFIATQALPRVPYLTTMDLIILLSVVTIGATMIVNIVVEHVTDGAPETAHRVDTVCRFVFPVVYFGTFLLLAVRHLA
jgi:hypothetical protein